MLPPSSTASPVASTAGAVRLSSSRPGPEAGKLSSISTQQTAMPVQVVAPMTGKRAAALGAKGAAELGQHVSTASFAIIIELAAPQRDQLRQIARSCVSESAGGDLGAENALGGRAVACSLCC